VNLQLDIPTLPPTWARRDAEPFPTYVGTAAAPAPPPLAPVEGELLGVDEALWILDLLIRNRRSAAEPPTLVVTPGTPLPSWSELLEGDDEEAVDLDRFCASFVPDRELATARGGLTAMGPRGGAEPRGDRRSPGGASGSRTGASASRRPPLRV
jgi:hypothetical protein